MKLKMIIIGFGMSFIIGCASTMDYEKRTYYEKREDAILRERIVDQRWQVLGNIEKGLINQCETKLRGIK